MIYTSGMAAFSPRASILTIGTELTSGQITNRNAAWISEKLTSLGLEVVLHETVPDQHDLMMEALERCSQVSGFIFVTGGLGPTQDDFTRDVIALWLGRKLEFHPPSWQHILERLGRFGVPVAESNRRQCFFPTGSEIFPNTEGTACAFAVELPQQGKSLWVLPGPPREVAACWRGGIDARLRNMIENWLPELKPTRLFLWSCMGKSEAALGEITEAALSGSGLLTGYRAHLPFVEVKVWVPEADLKRYAGALEKLDLALKPWTVSKNGEDLGARFVERLSFADEIEIYDAASGGYLGERLGALLRRPGFERQAESFDLHTAWTQPVAPSEWVDGVLAQAEPDTLCLALAGFTPGSGEWALGLRHGTLFKKDVLQSPYKIPELLERVQRHAVEVTFKRAGEWLDEAFH